MELSESLPPDVRPGADGHLQASFAVGNRLKRLCWNTVYVLFFRPSPRPFHSWRSFLLRSFGAKLGSRVHVYPKTRIWAPWNLDLGDECCLADDVNCYSMALVKLGSRAIVSQGASLCTGSHDYRSPNFQLISSPIEIGEGAWVCAEAFIGPGVSIGKECVVGARAVVVKDMPPGMVCAGNPARPIKPRYDEPRL